MKRLGDSTSLVSPEIKQKFETFFYRISIQSVRVTLLLSMFLYVILYFIALPISHPTEQALFWPAFIIVFFILSSFFATTFTSLYLSNLKLGNTIIAICSSAGISFAMFTVESISPILLYLTSLTMIACTVAFGMQWNRAVAISVSYFALNLFLVSQSSIPFSEYTLALFSLFGFMLIGIINGYMVSLLLINSFILKANGKKLIETLKTNENKYRQLSLKDGLTQLFNRRHFDEVGEIKTANARRNSSPLHLLVIDIDKFKEFNDTYGHPEGDAALLSVALLLKKTFRRPTDLIFRIGGEEFAVITEGDDSKKLNLYTQALHSNIAREAIPHTSSCVTTYLTVSIGMANLDATANNTFADLYNRADKALYHAKQSGRNQTIIY